VFQPLLFFLAVTSGGSFGFDFGHWPPDVTTPILGGGNSNILYFHPKNWGR